MKSSYALLFAAVLALTGCSNTTEFASDGSCDGVAVVCRVNNVPSKDSELLVEGEDPYLETCEEMPAAFAYWGLWVKESPQAEWGYAMEGISSLQLTKVQSVGLAFSIGGQAPTP